MNSRQKIIPYSPNGIKIRLRYVQHLNFEDCGIIKGCQLKMKSIGISAELFVSEEENEKTTPTVQIPSKSDGVKSRN